MNPGVALAAAFFPASPSLPALLAAFEQAAASDAPALVLGEAGTGRSSLARLLHVAGPRAAAPLVEFDPAAVPTSLFESELFGYRAGAFTGAERANPGRIERARGGTLLIDPVEELPLAVQPKLLRLLAERRYAPLGGEETEADVRFLAVGPDDLAARVARGAFREDLFFRLEVLPFRVPPLRERGADVPALARALLADLSLRFGRPELALSERSRAWMQEHSWPGNARQMKNLLERELLARDGALLDPDPPADPAPAHPRSLEQAEREAILAALAHTRGHQERAATLLGISRKGLWEKRRRLGLP